MLKLATKFAPEPAAFERAHRVGYRCAEIFLDARVLANRHDWLPVARHYPFEYVVHFPNRVGSDGNILDQAVDVYRQLGCRCLVIHQPMYDAHREALLQREPSLVFAVENHNLDHDGLHRWAERNTGLALDVEHLWMYTLRDAPLQQLLEMVSRFLEAHAGRTHHVHLPGYLPGYREHRPMYCAREMIFPVLSLLARSSFSGLIVSEVDLEYQNDEELRMDVLLFDAWRARHANPNVLPKLLQE